MKKGNLTEALEEAIDLWIKSDVIEAIKKKALSKEITENDFKLLVDTLTSQGKEALPALSELLNKDSLSSPELEVTADAIRKISSPQTSKLTINPKNPFQPYRDKNSSPV